MLFTVLIPVIAFVVAAVIFFYIGIAYRKKIAESTVNSAEEQAKRIIEDSKKDAERTKKEVNELPDHYIARLITRHSKILKPTDLLNQTEFLNTYRINLKLKRLCKELTI